MDKKCYIGPAGWSYKDWKGIVYPSTKKKNFSQLRYISKFLTYLEIEKNVSSHTLLNYRIDLKQVRNFL